MFDFIMQTSLALIMVALTVIIICAAGVIIRLFYTEWNG